MDWTQQQLAYNPNPRGISRKTIGSALVIIIVLMLVAFVFIMDTLFPFTGIKQGTSATIGIGAFVMCIMGFREMDKLMGVK